ncbi:ABC transporter substrate-binding protein [Acidocella sp.]|uniref:ABC transporter substrate-binding protein n=1 Tax=Acidocella sp. TaxID=50710 RepID=UPI003D025B35
MKNSIRFPALALAASLLIMPSAHAATSPSSPVSELDTGLLAAMKSAAAGQDFQARYKTLAPIVESAYDFPEVTKNSVGFLWSTLPPDQQNELIELLEQFTISSYVSQFNGYNGQKLSILPDEKPLGDKKIIETKLASSDGSGVVIDYVVSNTENGWKINDVLLNGTISQVAVHASDFASKVKSGDASQLIAALKSKIKTLQGG